MIRAPQSSDEFAWRGLWSAYLEFYQAEISLQTAHRTWERILASNNAMFGRLAELNGAVIGFSISVVHESTWSVRSTCYLEDLFVAPVARASGVGRALIDDLVTLAGERGWSSLYWHTRAENAQARRLYDRYVLADDFVRYRLTLQSE